MKSTIETATAVLVAIALMVTGAKFYQLSQQSKPERKKVFTEAQKAALVEKVEKQMQPDTSYYLIGYAYETKSGTTGAGSFFEWGLSAINSKHTEQLIKNKNRRLKRVLITSIYEFPSKEYYEYFKK